MKQQNCDPSMFVSVSSFFFPAVAKVTARPKTRTLPQLLLLLHWRRPPCNVVAVTCKNFCPLSARLHSVACTPLLLLLPPPSLHTAPGVGERKDAAAAAAAVLQAFANACCCCELASPSILAARIPE